MTPEKYRTARKSVGTQQAAATALGLSRRTIHNREHGIYPITREAEIAILALAKELPKKTN